MSFSQPKPVDPGQSSNAQFAYNTLAGLTQQNQNEFNQQNPYGSLTYASDPNSPSGKSAVTSLAPAQQAILDQLNQTKLAAGQAAGGEAGTAAQLAGSLPGLYGQPFDLQGPTGATAQMLNQWQQKYLSPIFQQQQSNLDAQLQNQGLTPGSTAYNNAQNLLARNQGDVTNQYLTQNQGQAFNQSLQQYGLPLQVLQSLQSGAAGAPSPTSPNASFVNPPQIQVQAPNYQQAAQNQFNAQQQQFQNTIQGIGQVAGVAAAPFTGGLSLGALAAPAMSGMFGGGWGSGNLPYNPGTNAWYNQ